MDGNIILFQLTVNDVALLVNARWNGRDIWNNLSKKQQRFLCQGMTDFIYAMYDNSTDQEMLLSVLYKMEEAGLGVKI